MSPGACLPAMPECIEFPPVQAPPALYPIAPDKRAARGRCAASSRLARRRCTRSRAVPPNGWRHAGFHKSTSLQLWAPNRWTPLHSRSIARIEARDTAIFASFWGRGNYLDATCLFLQGRVSVHRMGCAEADQIRRWCPFSLRPRHFQRLTQGVESRRGLL